MVETPRYSRRREDISLGSMLVVSLVELSSENKFFP